MFGSLVSMVRAQALVWCLTGCFSYNNNWEKTPSHSGKKQFFTDYVYNCLCNEPEWLAGIDYLQRKNLKSCINLQKRAFLANTQHQCFAYCRKRIHSISITLAHCIECLSTFNLNLRELEKLKAWNNRNVPIYLFDSSVNIVNCIGLRKKFLRLGLIISVIISNAEVFVLHWSNGGK